MTATATTTPPFVVNVVKGRVERAIGGTVTIAGQQWSAPEFPVDRLVWARTEPLPASAVPVAEIIDLLAATGDALRADSGGVVSAAFERLTRLSTYGRPILEACYAGLADYFDPDRLRLQLERELGGPDVVDGWRPVGATGTGQVRAFPARVLHVLAGNAPGIAPLTIARGALTKGVHLLKMPSNDVVTASMVLEMMAGLAPEHPTVVSLSSVYWRGGDPAVEGVLFRPQYFDKIVAWGGETAIRNVARYLGPGLELVSFDPKSSVSMIGQEAFDDDATIAHVAARAAEDSVFLNQEACTTSRFHFVEDGDPVAVDRYCATLLTELRRERRFTAAQVSPPPPDVVEELNVLAEVDPDCRVFGEPDGRGLVIRSAEPVDFYPSGKTVNVVTVSDLREAVDHVNVATQTVGMYPASRKGELRDALCSAGVQRVVPLGTVPNGAPAGFPHDGFYPMQRLVRWVTDEGGSND